MSSHDENTNCDYLIASLSLSVMDSVDRLAFLTGCEQRSRGRKRRLNLVTILQLLRRKWSDLLDVSNRVVVTIIKRTSSTRRLYEVWVQWTAATSFIYIVSDIYHCCQIKAIGRVEILARFCARADKILGCDWRLSTRKRIWEFAASAWVVL